ncbi:hypothetical protein A2Z33_00350 [Candidatus Gottesmanbacteria bacterium RBG_16_52_11]|uniref:Uncharacterized protein n=1 Tax=Candidatus Gottesmanbacteria bacterium RBG_16_52_11 TaxID=1798374 RepID=A0A1F5YMS1_9BACT|nr:MAG: hypothetical protein A2Z33_00350 [Candidatus Gottesmanbacteria bacterium RBG_16_52_11]
MRLKDEDKAAGISFQEAAAAARRAFLDALHEGRHYESALTFSYAAELFSLSKSDLRTLRKQDAAILILPADGNSVHVVIIRPEVEYGLNFAPAFHDKKQQKKILDGWIRQLKEAVQSGSPAVQNDVIRQSAYVLGLVEFEGMPVTGMLDISWQHNDVITGSLEVMRLILLRNEFNTPDVDVVRDYYLHLWNIIGAVNDRYPRQHPDFAPEYLIPPDTAVSPPV